MCLVKSCLHLITFLVSRGKSHWIRAMARFSKTTWRRRSFWFLVKYQRTCDKLYFPLRCQLSEINRSTSMVMKTGALNITHCPCNGAKGVSKHQVYFSPHEKKRHFLRPMVPTFTTLFHFSSPPLCPVCPMMLLFPSSLNHCLISSYQAYLLSPLLIPLIFFHTLSLSRCMTCLSFILF